MSERILITKIVRTGATTADLVGQRHQYADLHLFDLASLADVGIKFEDLVIGAEMPVRFWAHYELSAKLNKAGNPYRDVVMLESIDHPATATSTDTTPLLAELRAIRALLEVLASAATGDQLPLSLLEHLPNLVKAPAQPTGNGAAAEATQPAAPTPNNELDTVSPPAPEDLNAHFPRYADGSPLGQTDAETDAYELFRALNPDQLPANVDALRAWIRARTKVARDARATKAN